MHSSDNWRIGVWRATDIGMIWLLFADTTSHVSIQWRKATALVDKRTKTLNPTESEMKAVEKLRRRKDLNKTALIRQTIRLHQLIDARIESGEKLSFADGAEKAELMVVL